MKYLLKLIICTSANLSLGYCVQVAVFRSVSCILVSQITASSMGLVFFCLYSLFRSVSPWHEEPKKSSFAQGKDIVSLNLNCKARVGKMFEFLSVKRWHCKTPSGVSLTRATSSVHRTTLCFSWVENFPSNLLKKMMMCLRLCLILGAFMLSLFAEGTDENVLERIHELEVQNDMVEQNLACFLVIVPAQFVPSQFGLKTCVFPGFMEEGPGKCKAAAWEFEGKATWSAVHAE